MWNKRGATGHFGGGRMLPTARLPSGIFQAFVELTGRMSRALTWGERVPERAADSIAASSNEERGDQYLLPRHSLAVSEAAWRDLRSCV